MGRYINWDDKFCPNGHRWQFTGSSGLFPDFYYCKSDDKFWEPTVKEVSEIEIQEAYNVERPNEMKKRAMFLTWLDTLTPNDMPAPPTKEKQGEG